MAIPQKKAVWEGLLGWGSYPRLSPLIYPCVAHGTTKKTCAPLIPALRSHFPQVIP
jgi:hypothetical protein